MSQLAGERKIHQFWLVQGKHTWYDAVWFIEFFRDVQIIQCSVQKEMAAKRLFVLGTGMKYLLPVFHPDSY